MLNRRDFIKLLGGVAACAIIPNIPFKPKTKNTITGLDGNEYECVSVRRGSVSFLT